MSREVIEKIRDEIKRFCRNMGGEYKESAERGEYTFTCWFAMPEKLDLFIDNEGIILKSPFAPTSPSWTLDLTDIPFDNIRLYSEVPLVREDIEIRDIYERKSSIHMTADGKIRVFSVIYRPQKKLLELDLR